jgi:SAM-dependent methyltransferase/uncharacterized membrane protein
MRTLRTGPMQADEYRKLAEVEDRMWYFRALHRRLAGWLARLLPAGSARVLDAGCGTGGFIRSLRAGQPGWQVTGVDLSPVACGLARERTGAGIVEGSITALPFADSSFDAAVTGDVLYHVEDVAAALRELARCVRPGGVVLVNEPAYRWLWSYHDNAVESKHRFTRPELVALFEAAGLQVRFASYANMLMLPLVVARRKLFPPARPTSDVQLYPGPIEAGFSTLAGLEQAWTKRGWSLPAGSSVFVVGVKLPPAANSGREVPAGGVNRHMEKLSRLGRYCVGAAVAGTGLMQVINAGFVRLVPGLPAWLPAQPGLAVITGVALGLIGAAIFTGYQMRVAAFSLASLLLVVFGFRGPELAANSGALANPAKILAMVGGALLLSGRFGKWPWIAPALLGIFLLICGWAHFQYAGFVDGLVPAWIPPSQRFWTWFSAVALLAGGLGVILPPTRRLAGIMSGVMIFLWVLLLHIPRSVEMKSAFELAGVFEALGLAGVAWLIAAGRSTPATSPK